MAKFTEMTPASSSIDTDSRSGGAGGGVGGVGVAGPAPNGTTILTSEEWAGHQRYSGPYSCPYSPKLAEGAFSEARDLSTDLSLSSTRQ
jgi:hypothetical protein